MGGAGSKLIDFARRSFEGWKCFELEAGCVAASDENVDGDAVRVTISVGGFELTENVTVRRKSAVTYNCVGLPVYRFSGISASFYSGVIFFQPRGGWARVRR